MNHTHCLETGQHSLTASSALAEDSWGEGVPLFVIPASEPESRGEEATPIGGPCVARPRCHLPLSPTPSIPYHDPMPTHTDQPRTRGFDFVFFAIESHAWRAPSQLRIRNPNRIPYTRAHPPAPDAHIRRSCEGRACPCEAGEPRRFPAPTTLSPQRRKLRVQGKPCCPACFTPPFFGPFPYLRPPASRFALPLRGICLLSAPRDSNPRLQNKPQAGPPLPSLRRRTNPSCTDFGAVQVP